jgi:hypothetical protein
MITPTLKPVGEADSFPGKATPSPTDLEQHRNSDHSLEQRLRNSNEMLAAALNLIGEMQPVVRMAEAFVDYTAPGNSYPGLRKAVAKYREYQSSIENQKSKIENAPPPHDHVSPERHSNHALHGPATPA